jgi:hypothetical protein
MTDKTLRDIGRRNIEFQRDLVKEVLPEFYSSDYPELVTFLEKYYENLDSDGNFSRKIHDLFTTRDVQQTDQANLTYIEDELLLGQNYLEGWLNPRQAALLSNNFYRSKGTKYSIERFFRAFYGLDPVVEYGKNYVFNVGQDIIGPNSDKYLINDKVYQFWGILIKVGLPASEWLELYKLFAHPAGMYVGSEVQIVSVNADISFNNMPIAIPSVDIPVFSGVATITPFVYTDITGVDVNDSAGNSMRYNLDTTVIQIDNKLAGDTTGFLDSATPFYQNFNSLVKAASPTFDEDSDAAGSSMRMSSEFVTFDLDKYDVYLDSNGSGNLIP